MVRTRAARIGGSLVLAASALSAALAPARADDLGDAAALARKVVEAHRSDAHRARYEVVFPDAAALPRRGSVRIEARGGRFAALESGFTLEVTESDARLVLAQWTHVPVFASRASGKRDEASLLEATLTASEGRVALVACALLAGARERPKGTPEGPGDPKAPDLGPSAESDDAWPKLALDVDGRLARRRGPYAELARRVLEEVGGRLAPPLDPLAAARGLARDLDDPDAAPRAAYLLGEMGAFEALPSLAKLGFEEARDAVRKLAALAAPRPTAALLELSARAESWDVRAWARARLEALPETRGAWPRELILAKTDAQEDALVEGLRALEAPETDELRGRVVRLLDDGRAFVRVAAAAALLRWDDFPRAREVLVATARDPKAPVEAREEAIERAASVLVPSELARALSPVLAAPDAPTEVRAQVARAFDQSEDIAAAATLASVLEAEVDRARASSSSATPTRDLRVALTQALATVASVASDAHGEEVDDVATALALSATLEPDEELRALAIHATGALPGDRGVERVKAVLEREEKLDAPSRLALRAAEIELAAAKGEDERDRLEAIADAACEAPLRSTLDRLARAARDPRARAFLLERLRARGPLGEAGIETLERR
jgi:hypothetical protein